MEYSVRESSLNTEEDRFAAPMDLLSLLLLLFLEMTLSLIGSRTVCFYSDLTPQKTLTFQASMNIYERTAIQPTYEEKYH